MIIGLVVGCVWLRNEWVRRSETRRASGQLRLLGPTDELSELTSVVKQWADANGVFKSAPADLIPSFEIDEFDELDSTDDTGAVDDAAQPVDDSSSESGKADLADADPDDDLDDVDGQKATAKKPKVNAKKRDEATVS